MLKELIHTNIFFCESKFGKNKVKFPLPLSTGPYRQRSERGDFGKNSYPLLASASFPGSYLQAPEEVQCFSRSHHGSPNCQ